MEPPKPHSLLTPLVVIITLLHVADGELQTLAASPLLRSPDLVLPGDLLTWTAVPETLPESETSTSDPTSLRLPLAHLDSLLPSNSTPEHLLHLRLRRDAARVSDLGSLAAAAGRRNASRHQHRSFSSSVISGLAQGSGEYFTRIGIGTPPAFSFMVLDTGSDVVWIQCAPCRRCYQQSDPVFDPRKSRSYASVPCGAALCRQLDVSGCDVRRRSCLYQVSYGDGSVTTGDFSTETFTFRSGARVGRIAVGCGHDNEGLFVAAAGLLGLGRGPLSFPSQAARRLGRRFSYCLVDRTSSAAKTPRPTSSVIFGDGAVPKSTKISFTPMLLNPKLDTFYYISLQGISVGGSKVAGVLASDLRLDPSTGRGGVIIDSGTSVTRLARPAYAALREAFKAGAAGLRAAPGGFSLFDTCYDLAGRTEVKVPTVVMHLDGGADVSLPAENYLIPVDTKGTFCFAFAGTDSGISIIGNIQQQGFRVVFDAARSQVGFAAGGC